MTVLQIAQRPAHVPRLDECTGDALLHECKHGLARAVQSERRACSGHTSPDIRLGERMKMLHRYDFIEKIRQSGAHFHNQTRILRRPEDHLHVGRHWQESQATAWPAEIGLPCGRATLHEHGSKPLQDAGLLEAASCAALSACMLLSERTIATYGGPLDVVWLRGGGGSFTDP